MRLKALLVGAAVLLAQNLVSVSHASAQSVVATGSAGNWTWFQGTAPDGKRVCTISTTVGERELHIKHFSTFDHMVVHVMKASWNIPANTSLHVMLQLGEQAPWNAPKASGYKNTVQLRIGSAPGEEGIAAMKEFFAQLRQGAVARVAFPEGAEPTWTMSLAGSSAVMARFMECLRTWSNAKTSGPTQPFGAGNTPAPSQPAAPTQPHEVQVQPGLQISGPARRS